ncbi:MAG TPA: response regulator [Nitrososphaeraceae archaeon]|nr:response regulator [Nitrososphaeraceae archaeon]
MKKKSMYIMIYLLKILLVEDEKDILNLFQKFFERSGFYVSAFSEPLLAVQEFMKNNDDNDYDLVISDIRMPEMNGIELASIIRKKNIDIPIILMTAYNTIGIEPSILKSLNIEDIISKPVKLKDLIAKINTVKQKIIVKDS